MTRRVAIHCAGLATACAVLLATVSPLLCLCASAAAPVAPPACHASTAGEKPEQNVSAPCCCVGAGGALVRAVTLTTSDERAPKLVSAAPVSPGSELVLSAVEFAAGGPGVPSAHSPPGLRVPLRI